MTNELDLGLLGWAVKRISRAGLSRLSKSSQVC